MKKLIAVAAVVLVSIAALLFDASALATPGVRSASYKILEADSHTDLQASVNAEIANGWAPQGGVAVAVNPRTYG